MSEYLERNCVQVLDEVPNWRDAIRIASKPLLENGSIRSGYVDAMITTVETLGSYIVIAPDIAMPHSESRGDVLKNCYAILKLKQSVSFDDNSEDGARARLIIPIASVDNKSHLGMLQNLAIFLSTNSEQVLETNDPDIIYSLFCSSENKVKENL